MIQQNQFNLPVITQSSDNDISREFNDLGQGEPQYQDPNVASEEAENKQLKEVELNAKLVELVTSDGIDIGNGIYGRDFMATLWELQKVFKSAPCPLSPSEINDFGLDIETMRRKIENKPNFTTHRWQPKKTRSRNLRGGRTTNETKRGGSKYIDWISRLTLATSKDAWKPERQKPTNGSLKTAENDADKESIQTICKKVRALFNKITTTSKDDLINEFIGYNVSSNDDQLSQVVEIILDKAIQEPKFCALYAEVCKDQIDLEIKTNYYKSIFRNKILMRMYATFLYETVEINQENEVLMQNETDPAKKGLMEAGIREEHVRLRSRRFGITPLIAHFYRNQLLSFKIIHNCVYELLKTILPEPECQLQSKDIDEESVQCALQLIVISGDAIDRATSVFLREWFIKMEKAKPLCGNKTRFMIMDVIELRKNKWVR